MTPASKAPALAIALAGLACASPAQFALTVPDGAYATTEGNSNFVLPWNVGANGGRVQFCHDSSVFTGQGLTGPTRITGLRYRIDAIANTWSGGTYPNVTISMSTCASDYLAVSNTFANNPGPDQATVLSGPVVVTAGTGGNAPSAQYVDITLTTPFVYDPTLGGDLLVDITVGTGWVGNGGVATGPVDHVGPGAAIPALGSRVWISGTPGAATGNPSFSPTFGYSPVCEFVYEPAVGLWPNFSVTPNGAVTPMAVQFTDRSVSDAPNGIVSWQWDLDGDSVVDSTAQNPTFTYTNCGSYTVTLTVIDPVNGQRTLTRPNFIVTDVVQTSFTYTLQPGGVVQFTDTSTPTPTSWAWDFDGDTVVDSTAQNPVWAYSNACKVHQVSLAASRACGPVDTEVLGVAVAPNALTTSLTTTLGTFGSLTGNLFDVQVTNQDGINICGITTVPYSDGTVPIGAVVGCQIYVTDATGGYVANHANAAVWRLAATGTGFYRGGNAGSPRPIALTLDRSIYLPAGNYGFAVYMTGCGMAYRTGTINVSTADLTITAGSSKFGLFTATQTTSRPWCGTLHYDTLATGGSAGFGFFGAGCAGTAGITKMVAASPAQLGGTLSVDLDNLPLSAAVMLIGLSRTTAAFGPLPFDTSVIGMPGCLARVSLDAAVGVAGSGGTANWTFAIPSAINLIGFKMFQQALVIDPTANAFGAVLSDATATMVGI